MQKKHLSAAIAIALTLTLAATLITALPLTLGALPPKLIGMTAGAFMLPRSPVNGTVVGLVGINQPVSIFGVLYPRPTKAGDVYKNVEFRFTRPNGTTFFIYKDTNIHSEVDYFDVTMDQLGAWSVRMFWAGDSTHESASSTTSWTVQAAAVTLQEPVFTQAHVATVPYDYLGQGQTIYIIGWINPPREVSGAVFYDCKFTITKPDGTTVTHVEDTSSEATTSFSYLCDKLGTYSVVLSYAGGRFWKACESPAWTWTVGEEQVPAYSDVPLPTGAWREPVSSEYYEWYQITGAWPGTWYDAAGSNFNPYSRAPNTAHILYTKQMGAGGMIGQLGWSGRTGSPPSMVAAMGRMYYTTSEGGVSGTGTTAHPVLHCLDQYTGEELWTRDLPGTGAGGTIGIEISARIKIDPKIAESVAGAFTLWVAGGGLWEINPITGATSWYMTGDYGYSGDAGLNLYDGAIYISNYPNSSYTSKFDCRSKEIVWSARGISISTIESDLIASESRPTGGIPENAYIRSWSTETGEPVAEGSGTPMSSYNPQRWVTMGDGNMFAGGADRRMRAMSATTGKTVWTSEPTDYPWGVYFTYNGAYAYHNYYEGCWDGYMYCFDGATGAIEWRFFLGNTTETAMGHLVPWGRPMLADGKVYFAASQHTPPTPTPRDHKLFCVDAFTGEYIWSMPFYSGGGGIASGMLWEGNSYDGNLYMFGKGASDTTVSAPTTTVPLGTGVLIQGTVTDQSPGMTSLGIPAAGTPAIADASMGPWMEYLYQNKPMPTDATGVSVMLQAMAPDGTVIDIATVTSDIMGHYEYTWTPTDQGTYKILATFLGSESYWMSSTQTALSVGAAPPATGAVEAAPDNTPMFAGIIIAVVIVAILVVYDIVTVRKLRK